MSDGGKNTYKNNEREEDKATSKRREREMRRINKWYLDIGTQQVAI